MTFDGGPLHGEMKVLPEHVMRGHVVRVPVPEEIPVWIPEVDANRAISYRVAEYRIRGTVAEFERWGR